MSIMDRLENRLRRTFLSRFNLMIVLVACYALGYIIGMVSPAFLNYLLFDPEYIFQGQVWRLITWILTPESSGFFMALITCFIYFSISKSLEMVIGTFRLNFFLLSGLLMNILMGFLYYALFPAELSGFVVYLNPYYLYAMLFVLFAMMFPDARFLFMFIFPIKGKWMIAITFLMYAVNIISAFANGIHGYAWIMVFMAMAATLALILFLLLSGFSFKRRGKTAVNFRRAQAEIRRRSGTGRVSNGPVKAAPRHKCEICGRNSDTHPELDFRYCSKCYGNHEYCTDHLYTHIHIKDPNDIASNFTGNGDAT